MIITITASPATKEALYASGTVPEGYVFTPAVHGAIPGTIQLGPYDNLTVTVHLLPGDTGEWLLRFVCAHNKEMEKE